jgi:MFS family permease
MNNSENKNGKGHFRPVMENKKKEKKYSKNVLKFYLYGLFINIQTVSGVLVPFFLEWGQISFLEIMFLQSYFMLMIFLFEVPSGAIADFLGRKWTMFSSGIITGMAALIYSSTPNIFIFAIGESFWALGAALSSGAAEAFLYDTLKIMDKKEDFSKIWGRTNSISIFGIMIAGPIGSIIAEYISLQFTMTFSFFPMIIATIISFTFKEPNSDIVKESKRYLSILRKGFLQLKNSKTLRLLAFDMISVNILSYFIIWTYQLYLAELNVPLIFFGFVLAMMTFTEMVFMNLIPKLMKWFKKSKRYLLFSTLMVGGAFIFMSFTTIIPISIILILIVMAFGFSRRLIFADGINKQIESESRATVLSAISMLGGIFQALLNPFVGLMVTWNLYAVFIFLGTAIVIIAIISPVKNEYL